MIDFEDPPPGLRSSTGLSILARRSPQLTNGHGLGGADEKARVGGMPLGDVFIETMRRAWSIQEARRRESMSPKCVIVMLGYPRYIILDGLTNTDTGTSLRLLGRSTTSTLISGSRTHTSS